MNAFAIAAILFAVSGLLFLLGGRTAIGMMFVSLAMTFTVISTLRSR